MFAYIKGTLTSSTSSQVIVEANGIGYLILTPANAMEHLPPLGSIVQFYTSFVVREFSHSLYGFLTAMERDLFELLLTVTGIGPKLALSVIGHMSISDLQTAVSQHNVTMLCKVPGIGKKTGERLIIELKDKLMQMASLEPLPAILMQHPRQGNVQDAMMALINLGYNQAVAKKVIGQCLKELPEDSDLAALVTCSLKKMS